MRRSLSPIYNRIGIDLHRTLCDSQIKAMKPTSARENAMRDFLHPDWKSAGRVHDWRNYINEELRAMWDTFTPEQKEAIARNADEIASNEDWD